MVVFLCSFCNASLRKNNVEIHFSHCRGCRTVSCMDCLKDFDKVSFKSHTSCISEKEKYDKTSAADSKTSTNKQKQWISMVQDAISKIDVQDPLIRQVMQDLQSCENVPRKKMKFLNFMKSKYRRLRADQMEYIWDLLNRTLSTIASDAVSEPAVKKRILDGELNYQSREDPVQPSFSLTKNARQLLKSASGSLPLDVLTSKLYAVYRTSNSSDSPLLSVNDFEKQLSSTISSKKSFSYSESDGLVHLINRKAEKEASLLSCEGELEKPETKDDSILNRSVKAKLSDWVVDTLQANGGQLKIKKLLKQMFSHFSTATNGAPPLSKEDLQHRLEKRLKKPTKFTLSADGKYVLLLQNGVT